MGKFHKVTKNISTSFRPKDRAVSYKYPKGMESHNMSTYAKSGQARYTGQQFKLDEERRKVRDGSYQPKRDFSTHHGATFENRAD